MTTKDKLIKKLEDYVDYLITYPHSSFKRDKFESEIALLKEQKVKSADIPMGEMKSASYMQIRDLTDEEWLQLSKEEVIQLYKNCYEMLTQFTTQRQESSEELTAIIAKHLDGYPYDSRLHKKISAIVNEFVAQRQEITDEEIEVEADLQYGNTTIIPETAFIAGAKWMRDKQGKGIDLREEFDKMNCLIGYLEGWLNNPRSEPPFELKDVINEATEYLIKIKPQ